MPRGRSLVRAVLVTAALAGSLAYVHDAEAAGGRKAGPFMANLKVGPAIGLDDLPTQFSLEIEAGIALDHAHNLYLSFPPQFQFSDGLTTIILPLSIQYDIELPVKGLYLYPKLNVGGAIFTGNGYLGRNVQGAFALQPEFGVKYLITDNVHIGFEPVSLPLYLGNKHDGFDIQYRLYFYAGIDL